MIFKKKQKLHLICSNQKETLNIWIFLLINTKSRDDNVISTHELFPVWSCQNTKLKMSQEFSVITQSVVTLSVTSSMNSFGSERRFQKDLKIAELKVAFV